MDPMPEGCRRRVRLYAGNGLIIKEIINIKSIVQETACVKVVCEDGVIITLHGTIVVEDNPAWNTPNL
jgi:hypothetical protein